MIALIAQYVPASMWSALAGLAAILGAWAIGRRDGGVAARNKAKAATDAAYRSTTERMNDAGNDNLDDDAIRERLRKLGGK